MGKNKCACGRCDVGVERRGLIRKKCLPFVEDIAKLEAHGRVLAELNSYTKSESRVKQLKENNRVNNAVHN